MIEHINEILSGERQHLHGDVDIQLINHVDGMPRLSIHQAGDMSHDAEQRLVLDAAQIAHLHRALDAMVRHGANLNNAPSDSPQAGGV